MTYTFSVVYACNAPGFLDWDPHNIDMRSTARRTDGHATELAIKRLTISPIVLSKLDNTDKSTVELIETEEEPQTALASFSVAFEERSFDKAMVSKLVTLVGLYQDITRGDGDMDTAQTISAQVPVLCGQESDHPFFGNVVAFLFNE